MTQIHEVIAESQKLLSDWGLPLDDPLILRDAGNLTLWLRPYPIVARVATLFSGDDADFWGAVWQRELRVAAHLTRQNVPIVAPTTAVPAGPHRVAGTWMTLWNYAQAVECPPLGMDGLAMVSELTRAMGTVPEPLPR